MLSLLIAATLGSYPLDFWVSWKAGDVSRPYLSVAPPDGAGLGAPCSCLPFTGAKGEVIATTRAAPSHCTKYHPTDNIQPGDVVLCGNDTPRIAQVPGLGLQLMVDWPTTNLVSWAHELGSWLTLSSAGVPTVTANQHAGPNALTQADRLQVAACPTAGQASAVYTTITTAASNNVGSVYVLGNGASGTINVCLWDGAAGTCAPCSYVSTGAKLCSVIRNTAASASSAMVIGCNNQAGYFGASNTGAADVFVWGMQVESGAAPSAIVLTSGAPAARGAGDRFRAVLDANAGQAGSIAVTYTPRHSTTFVGASNLGGPVAFINNSGSARLLYNNGTGNLLAFDGTFNPSLSAGYVYMTPKRYCSRWSTSGGWVIKNITDGTSTSSAFATGTFAGASPNFDFGAWSGFNFNGYLSDVCFSRDPLECCP